MYKNSMILNDVVVVLTSISFVNDVRVAYNSNATGVKYGTGTANLSLAPAFTFDF
jgi:hypothetical protein